MARSHSVYLVLDPGLPPAAFTVKHELEGFMRGTPDPGGRQLWRCRDGHPEQYPAVLLDLETLEPK